VPMDPHIHFALVCASRSCPVITVYHASQIEEELEAAATTFVIGLTFLWYNKFQI